METADLSHHISRRFNEDLEKVRNQVLSMGGFVEEQLSRAVSALVEGDSELGQSVAHDDYKVNRMEVSIDEECSRILAAARVCCGRFGVAATPMLQRLFNRCLIQSAPKIGPGGHGCCGTTRCDVGNVGKLGG
ncbi:MAG: hypothetical protein EBR52_09915 [Microbacteriaceae bacterium]|nr:hypothetical protein [Microbacteriaceae bacterium]